MGRRRTGERIGAILSGSDEEIRFLGYGTYVGDRLVPDWEQFLPPLIDFHRDPVRYSEEICAADAGWLCRVKAAQEEREVTETELEEATQSLIAERRRLAQMSDAELTAHLLDNERSSFLRNPYLEMDNGEHWWGREVWWGSEERVREMLAAARQRGARIVELTREDAGREPALPAD